MEITKLINGKVSYDQYGGQQIWIMPNNESNGGCQLLADVRAWGRIQNMFKDNKGNMDLEAAAKFQDEVGLFIAEAINEKLERLSNLK